MGRGCGESPVSRAPLSRADDSVGRAPQFFLTLYEYLSTAVATPGRLDDELQGAAEDVLDNSEGTVFDRERAAFENLAERSEELTVRHAAREVINELKAYFNKSVLVFLLFALRGHPA